MTRWLGVVLLQLSTSTDVFSPNYPSDCPQNEQYTTCSSSSCFEAVCSVAPSLFCTRDCKTGCQCMRGFARRGKSCVPLDECTGTSTIIWKSGGNPAGPRGVLRLQSSTNRCVSTGGSVEVGDILTMQDCNKMTDLQLDFGTDGIVHVGNKRELCLTTNNSQAIKAGDMLLLEECSSGANQNFRFSSDDGTIRASESTLCFENKPPTSTIALALCSGSNDQQWELADNGCLPAQTAPIIDFGVADDYRGWYDTQGCGDCRDYCRWVGSASGGDPAVNQIAGSSHWSCALAGSPREFTLPLYFEFWNFTKCSALISDQELQRSAAAAQDVALVLEAELPTVPRSVPRKSLAPTLGNSITSGSTSEPSGTTANSTSETMNMTGTANITTQYAQPQANQLDGSVSPSAYAIPLGIVIGVLFLAVLFYLLRRTFCRKDPQPPLVTVPADTVVVPARQMAVPSAPTSEALKNQIPPRIVVIPTASDDPPPPYHSIDTLEPVVVHQR